MFRPKMQMAGLCVILCERRSNQENEKFRKYFLSNVLTGARW